MRVTQSNSLAEKTMSATSATNRVEGTRAMRGRAAGPFSQDGMGKKRTTTTPPVILPAYNEQYLIATSLSRLSVLNESPLLQMIKFFALEHACSGRSGGADRC